MDLLLTNAISGIETLNRAFSAAFMDDRIPGAVPQAKDDIAPLALTRCCAVAICVDPWLTELCCSVRCTPRRSLVRRWVLSAVVPTALIRWGQRTLQQARGED